MSRTRTVLLAETLIATGVVLALVYLNLLVTLLTLTAAFGYLVPYTLRLKRTSIPGAIPGALTVLIGYGAVSPTSGPDLPILSLPVLIRQPPHFWTLALRYQEDHRATGFLPATRVSLSRKFPSFSTPRRYSPRPSRSGFSAIAPQGLP